MPTPWFRCSLHGHRSTDVFEAKFTGATAWKNISTIQARRDVPFSQPAARLKVLPVFRSSVNPAASAQWPSHPSWSSLLPAVQPILSLHNAVVLTVQEALHPTPAVCGRPQADAYSFLQQNEPFDRGFYAGPFGFLSSSSAEFVVGIRSALIGAPSFILSAPLQPLTFQTPIEAQIQRTAFLYAGVGVVHGSDAETEWRELDLKVSQFRRILPALPNLMMLPNDNAVWAALIVDELVRCGVMTFAVAPGSRSSPLAHAVFRHPRSEFVVCIDERSLGYWAVGHAVATGNPVTVITTSGTAVANLLPAVVEASMSHVPLIILSADRPGELRATGANQTIDQIKIFGGYVRYMEDLQPPGPHVLGASSLTTVDAAVRHAVCPTDPGPVHVNCQFRAPLAPAPEPLSTTLTSHLALWEASRCPFTFHVAAPLPPLHAGPPSAALAEALALLAGAQRGMVVVGQLRDARHRVAALRIARSLGWPLVADILSGLRVNDNAGAKGDSQPAVIIHHLDTLLTDANLHKYLRPDCILQIGAPFVSKRISQFLASSARGSSMEGHIGPPVPWLLVSQRPHRRDEHHCVSAHVEGEPQHLAASLTSSAFTQHIPKRCSGAYCSLLAALDASASACMQRAVLQPAHEFGVTEPAVAMTLAQYLPPRHGLFIGSSMPIRDLDMYARLAGSNGLSSPVASNRGASGIDGVLSSAAGFAAGLQRPTTLLVGDVSFLHDTNGLLLLNDQSQAAPLTVVLINNSGGGIFHFLPVHDAVPEGPLGSSARVYLPAPLVL
jgi:isochorismate synthase / 2-succinyl-5-enolpyruvyl-6-hydroxy-3-cyclohexene-1-carboxylate synthase / 2-succinyl-6-hydroxy-2,4-cyclohexadiene-1-carboxylate synthase / o-succinylbenzoate synthase